MAQYSIQKFATGRHLSDIQAFSLLTPCWVQFKGKVSKNPDEKTDHFTLRSLSQLENEITTTGKAQSPENNTSRFNITEKERVNVVKAVMGEVKINTLSDTEKPVFNFISQILLWLSAGEAPETETANHDETKKNIAPAEKKEPAEAEDGKKLSEEVLSRLKKQAENKQKVLSLLKKPNGESYFRYADLWKITHSNKRDEFHNGLQHLVSIICKHGETILKNNPALEEEIFPSTQTKTAEPIDQTTSPQPKALTPKDPSDPPKKAPETSAPEAEEPRKKSRLFQRLMMAGPIASILGALTLFSTALIPENDKGLFNKPVAEHSQRIHTDTLIKDTEKLIVESTQEALNEYSSLYQQTGKVINKLTDSLLTGETPVMTPEDYKTLGEAIQFFGNFLISSGLILGGVNRATLGWNTKQPTAFVGGTGMIPAGFLFGSQPGLFIIALALFYTGFSNIIYNKIAEKKGEKQLKFDLAPLVSLKKLKKLALEKDINQVQAYLNHAFEASRFVGRDIQGSILKTLRMGQKPLRAMARLFEKAKPEAYHKEPTDENAKSLWERIQSIQPLPEHAEVGATLMSFGTLPMLIANVFLPEGMDSLVMPYLHQAEHLTTAGLISAEGSLFLIGMKGKRAMEKSLLAAVPMLIAGEAVKTTAGGQGMMGLSMGILNTYFAEEAEHIARHDGKHRYTHLKYFQSRVGSRANDPSSLGEGKKSLLS